MLRWLIGHTILYCTSPSGILQSKISNQVVLLVGYFEIFDLIYAVISEILHQKFLDPPSEIRNYKSKITS